MKRSDMIDLMWKFIQKVEYDYDIYMEKDDVEKLLSKMEKAGIEPPKCGKFRQENPSNRWGVTDFDKTETVRVIVNEWESEND